MPKVSRFVSCVQNRPFGHFLERLSGSRAARHAICALLPVLLPVLVMVGCECRVPFLGGARQVPQGTPPIPPSGETRAVTGERIIFSGQQNPAPRPNPNLIREPNAPDPEAGDFTLEEAVAGLGTDGPLVVGIRTSHGQMFCDLYSDRTPRAVAQFVGFARGLRPFWDARAGAWARRAMYQHGIFHRVVPGYIVQGGDYLEDGSGNVHTELPIETHETLAHDRAGRLVLAAADGKVGGQFYMTDGPHPELDQAHAGTIIGQCIPTEVVDRIAYSTQGDNNRPLSPITIEDLHVIRHPGGAADLMRLYTTPPPAG